VLDYERLTHFTWWKEAIEEESFVYNYAKEKEYKGTFIIDAMKEILYR